MFAYHQIIDVVSSKKLEDIIDYLESHHFNVLNKHIKSIQMDKVRTTCIDFAEAKALAAGASHADELDEILAAAAKDKQVRLTKITFERVRLSPFQRMARASTAPRFT